MVAASDQRITIFDLTPQEQDTLDRLVVQWRQKRPRNNIRAAYYDMKNSTSALMSSNAPTVVKRRKFVLGWSAIAVDKLNRRCNIDGFYDQAGADLGSLGLPEMERENMLRAELSQAGVSSLLHAVSWLVTVQGDTQAGEPDVLILPRDATTATGIWDVRKRALSSFLSLNEFDDQGEPTAMTMYLPGVNVIMAKAEGRWTVDRRPHPYGLPVDPMRYRARLGRPFGSSRLSRAVMSIHDGALGAMIRSEVNGEAYSMPRYMLLGATEEAFRNADGSPKPTWQAAWEAVWAIGDDEDLVGQNNPLARADVKQFQGQSPEPQNSHLRMLAHLFSGETGIPIGELGFVGDANPTSADALEAGKDDLIAEAEQTTDGWDPDISRALTRALRMRNRGDVPDDLAVRAQWRPHMHASGASATAAKADAGAKILSQFPWLAETSVGLELAGLTPDQITRAEAERRRAEGRQLLGRLRQPSGDAAQ